MTSDDVVGMWDDICAAEEFLVENEGPSDCWAVFPYEECTLLPVN